MKCAHGCQLWPLLPMCKALKRTLMLVSYPGTWNTGRWEEVSFLVRKWVVPGLCACWPQSQSESAREWILTNYFSENWKSRRESWTFIHGPGPCSSFYGYSHGCCSLYCAYFRDGHISGLRKLHVLLCQSSVVRHQESVTKHWTRGMEPMQKSCYLLYLHESYIWATCWFR